MEVLRCPGQIDQTSFRRVIPTRLRSFFHRGEEFGFTEASSLM